jgi:hypothetical protein
MPDPDRLLRTLRRAITACRDTPGRAGHLIYLTHSTEMLVAGDLHGHLGNVKKILDLADLSNHPTRHLVVQELVHGQHYYPDGGERSHQALDVFAALKCQFPDRVHMLLGNHELAQWTDRRISKNELDFNSLFRKGVDTAYGLRGDEVYATYCELFAILPVAIRTPNRVFLSHSLPTAGKMALFQLDRLEAETFTPEDLQPNGSVHSITWGRDVSLVNAQDFLRRVNADWLITGHVSCANGFDIPNAKQLILDCLGTPAGVCLFPTNRTVYHADLVNGVRLL